MKFTCLREKIVRAVSNAERFTGKNITLPVLANILFEFDGNSLCITATNLEHAIQTTISGNGSGSGRVTVPAKIMNSFLQSLKEDTVEIEERGGSIFIKTPAHDTKIHGISAQDFPLVPKVKKIKEFSLSQAHLSDCIQKVLPAVSQSEFKPELNGVLFKVSSSTLRCTATDTFRLAEKTIPFSKKIDEQPFYFILPTRSAAEISRILVGDGMVKVVVDDNQVLFDCGDTKVVSRLLEGNFPDYAGIIPKQYEVSATLSRRDIHDAVRASSIFASKLQDVSLSFLGKTIEVATQNHEIGEYRTETEAAMQGKKLKINFNYRYLLDGLSLLHEDEIFIGCSTDQSPILLRNKNDNSFFYIVMPIRAI